MTRIQRRLLIDTSIIGVAMTLLVTILDSSTRIFVPLDNWFYDRRARYCQYWTPKPTDKLIHIDLDDQALQTIGQWPWPRSDMAELIDEIDRAGAKAIAMDIIFSEPSNPTPRIVENAPGKFTKIYDDRNFADAIKRSGKVLVPVSLSIKPAADAVERKIRDYLLADLELTEADVFQRLLADPEKSLPTGARFPMEKFLNGRREAMAARISRELEKGDVGRKELRRRLLPRTDPELAGSPLLRLLDEEYDRNRALVPLIRFSQPIPPKLPPLVSYNGELAPIPELSQAAAYSGYVDYLQSGESAIIRALPLYTSYRGRLFPQMDLMLACAALGVDFKSIRLESSRIIIPKPPGRDDDIVIPVRNVYSPALGHDVGMFMDVPVRGTRNWEYMYDHGRYQRAELHIPAANIWEIRLIRERIAKNNRNIDRALDTTLGEDEPGNPDAPPRVAIDPGRLKAYTSALPPLEDTAPRLALVEWTRQQIKELGLDALLTMKDNEFENDRERAKRDEFARALKNLDTAIEQNKRHQQNLESKRASFHALISGRAVIIGWVASGKVDNFPTAIQPNCPGVVVHGLLFNAIMTGEFWRHAPRWITVLITIFIGLTVTAANGLLRPRAASVATALLGAAYLLINGFLFFDYGNWCVGVAAPVVALGGVWSTCTLAGFFIEGLERARITKRFSSYVDQKLVDHVIENPDAVLDGQVREMSVIFTDLGRFTELSEKLRERTVPILSEYLSLMVPIIRRHDGFVNKFLGDGIMCFFNAPNDDPEHATHAVTVCLEMQEAMKGFVKLLEDRGLAEVYMRCGVSSGMMVVGDSGPADASDYTVLGDMVNFASRLEGANKATGTLVLISERTSEMIGDKFLVRPVGKLQVVGKTEGVMTFEPLAFLDDATLEHRMLTAMSAEMVAAFVSRDFERCIKVADQMDAQFGTSKLAALYRKTSREHIETPPGPEFVGNLILTEK